MKQESPLSQWAAFQPRRPEGDFKAMPAGEAVMEIVRTQTDALTRLYRLCRDDPENGEWYRLEAFESCPGLTELWTDPFQAKYTASDGAVLIRCKTDADGNIHMAADVVEK